MRIAYYTHTAFLTPALHFTQEMSRRTEFHLLMEVAPEAWQNEAFELPREPLAPGIHPAGEVLATRLPARIQNYWRDVASFNLVVHQTRRSIHPRSWQLSREVARWMRRTQVDLIHFDNVSRRMTIASPTLPRVPVVLSVHDPIPHSGEQNWRSEFARRVAFRRVDRFILHSAVFKSAFCGRYGLSPKRVTCTRLGTYDLARDWTEHAPPADDRTVLFFGRLSPYKGLDVLYRAAVRVAERVRGVRFIVAGRPIRGYYPPPPPSLPGDSSILLLTQYLSNEHLASLLHQATVVTCPYIDATQSGVVLTAFGFRKPVVATAVGGIPEYVEDGKTGLLTTPGDFEALAAAIVQLLENRALRHRLQEGIEIAAEGPLNWVRIAERILALYRDLHTP